MINMKDITENLKQYNLNQDDLNVLKAGLKKLMPDLQSEEQKSIEKIKQDYEVKLTNAKENVIKNQINKIAKIFSIDLVINDETKEISNNLGESNE